MQQINEQFYQILSVYFSQHIKVLEMQSKILELSSQVVGNNNITLLKYMIDETNKQLEIFKPNYNDSETDLNKKKDDIIFKLSSENPECKNFYLSFYPLAEEKFKQDLKNNDQVKSELNDFFVIFESIKSDTLTKVSDVKNFLKHIDNMIDTLQKEHSFIDSDFDKNNFILNKINTLKEIKENTIKHIVSSLNDLYSFTFFHCYTKKEHFVFLKDCNDLNKNENDVLCSKKLKNDKLFTSNKKHLSYHSVSGCKACLDKMIGLYVKKIK